MTKLSAITLFAVFLLANVHNPVILMDTNEALLELNDRIFSIIDDLFISLKINPKMITSKNFDEYMAMHSYIQDVLHKNHKRYKEISNSLKTTINNKTADQISGVNEVIDEMIREKPVKNNSINNNETKISIKSESLKGFVDLVRVLKLKINELKPNDLTLWSSNTSQEVEVDGRRIFAGSTTGIRRYPFMASVHVAGRFVCAGSLLHESLVLSAASCLMRVRDEPDVPIQIRVGSNYVSRSGFLVTIGRLIFHPEFDRSTLVNNLVMLKTKKSLRFIPRRVVAIKYDKWDDVQAVLKGAKNVVILGWGRRSTLELNNTYDQALSRARIDVYDLEECKYIYTKEYVTEKNFCAGFVDRGEGACNHDGGGPALVGSLLAGVISFGSPRCGRVDAPTVFTRLSLYADWIQSTLDSVTIENGKVSNLQQFEVPASIEIGVGSEELDNETTDHESPRDKLKRVFGLKDVLRGPIDIFKDKAFNSSVKTEFGAVNDGNRKEKFKLTNVQDMLKQQSDVKGMSNGLIDSTQMKLISTIKPNDQIKVTKTFSSPNSAIAEEDQSQDVSESEIDLDQIKLSEESEEIATVSTPDEEPTLAWSHNKVDEIVKHLYENKMLKVDINITKMHSGEPSMAEDIIESENELITTTEAELTPKQTAKQQVGLGIGVTNDYRQAPITRSLGVDFGTKTKLRQIPKSFEASGFDVQYLVEIKPIYVKRSKTQSGNNTIIFISESGITERIDVTNAEKIISKLKDGIETLIKDMVSDRVKKRSNV